MSKTAPHREKVVSGAYGVGKVRIVYKPRRKPRINKIGFVVYFIFFSLIYISYAWTVPSLRERHVLPLFRTFSKYLDIFKIKVFSKFPIEFYGYSNQFHGPNKGNVTYITGIDENDLMFQQGQKHAVDRLYQMDIYRHIAMGTLSSIMGEQAFNIDKFSRALNFIGLARQDAHYLDDREREALQSYANGVNSVLVDENYYGHSIDFTFTSAWWWEPFFEESKYQLKPWETVHSLAIARLLHYQWNHDWEDELMTMLLDLKFGSVKSKVFSPPLPDKEVHLAEFVKYLPSLGGNIIAVSKEFSASDSAFIVHDLHSVNNYFGFFYANELHSPSLSASGLSFPGMPYVLIGRNEFVSWAFVPSLSKDTEDLYLLKNKSLNSSPRLNVEFTTRVETIEVYGKEETVTVEIEDTVLGPNILHFITDSLNGALSVSDCAKAILSSASLQGKMNFNFFHKLNTAKTQDEVSAAVALQQHANLHLVVALADGSIGHFQTGRELPRLHDIDSKRPILLESQEMINETVKLYANDVSVAHEKSFSNGMIIAADVLSVGSLLHQHYPSCQAAHFGASSFEDCAKHDVDNRRKFSDKEVEETLFDSYSPSGEKYAKFVKRGFTLNQIYKLQDQESKLQGKIYSDEFTTTSSSPFKESIDIYNNEFVQSNIAESSNGVYPLSSVGGTIIEGFRSAFINIFTRDAGPIGSILLGLQSAGIQRSTRIQAFRAIADPQYFQDHENKWILDMHGGLDKIIMSALEETVKWIDFNFDTKKMHKLVMNNQSVANLGPQNWNWGSVHTVTWNHPVVEISPFLDVVWSHGPHAVPGSLDSVFRSTYRIEIGIEGRDSLESKNSIVTSARIVSNMKDKNRFRTIALPTSSSLRPALNFFHNNNLAAFIAPMIDRLNSTRQCASNNCENSSISPLKEHSEL